MPITLAQAKVGMADKVDQMVVDEFQRSSLLLDRMIFDNAVSPGTGGSTLTYGYIHLKTPSTASIREINAEYTANEAAREKKSANIVVMGGVFNVDRVIQETSGAVDEITFQMQQKIKATSNYFHYLAINGKAATGTFDGLDKLMTGTDTAVSSEVDLSTSTLLDTNYNTFLDELDTFLTLLDGRPTMLLMNSRMLSKVRSAARRAGYYSRDRDDFGRYVETYNDIPLMDVGSYYDGVKSTDTIPVDVDGKSDIYAVNITLDGFHGISPTGNSLIRSYLPDMSQPGAVKKGEVELLAGVVLKNSKKAGVLRGVKIGA